MKHTDILKAYAVLEKLSASEMPLSVSYQLFRVKKLLKPQWEFQIERNDSIIKKYNPKYTLDGSIKFKNKQEGDKCAKELSDMIKEIGEMEVDFGDFKKPIITLNTDINLSLDDIDALSNFIEFRE